MLGIVTAGGRERDVQPVGERAAGVECSKFSLEWLRVVGGYVVVRLLAWKGYKGTYFAK